MSKILAHPLVIQAGGYLLLLALLYEWLGIGDRSTAQVLLSGLLGAAILLGAVWLLGHALAPALSLRRWPVFLAWVVVLALAVGGAIWLAGYRSRVGLSVASHLTLWFRRPVKPQSMASLYGALVCIVGTAVVLALLPLASAAAEGARQGARSALRQWRYWAGCAVMIAAGYWLPGLLLGWVPKFSGFGAQTASLIVRFSLAYVIALAAWLEIAWLARCFRSAATP